MKNENIVDTDADAERVEQLMESEEVMLDGNSTPLSDVAGDIQIAHDELDSYKSGSLSLAQTLSEAAKETDDEVLEAILADLSDGAFATYLRLHRGDAELLGQRDGDYSGYLTE